MKLSHPIVDERIPSDYERIAVALGDIPNIAYEAAHVYPMSAPNFRSSPGARRETPPPGPIKLYVHLPFCNYACRFCFYAKRVGSSHAQMERYVAALVAELETVAPEAPLRQLYIGGGTPTVLPAPLLDLLLTAIFTRFPPTSEVSRCVESSPESLSIAHIEVLTKHGIERTSLGVQSLDEEVLARINRQHRAAEAIEACELLVDRRFIVNVDLIYGLPGQSEESFRRDVATMAALRPDSFTVYDLRLNEMTPLLTTSPTFDRWSLAHLMRWRSIVLSTLEEHGYRQTRWHTFVRADSCGSKYDRAPCIDGYAAGRQLGIGMSAVSHLGGTVYRNHLSMEGYVQQIELGRSPVEGIFPLEEEDYRTLFVARSLGDGEGLDTRAYEQTFGSALMDDFPTTVHRLVAAGLIDRNGEQLFLTQHGRLVYDLVTVAFYPERARRWLQDRQQAYDGGGEGRTLPSQDDDG